MAPPSSKPVAPGRYHGVPARDTFSLIMPTISHYPPPPSVSAGEDPRVPRSSSSSVCSITPSMSPSQGERAVGSISDTLSTLSLLDHKHPPGASPTADFKPKLISRFQETAAFLDALHKIIKRDHRRRPHEATFKGTANTDENFHSFLNRIAELLDSRIKGKTVTAVLVQDAFDGYVYWIASNQRNEKEIKVAALFLEDLLTRVAELKSVDVNDAKHKLAEIFRRVLRFNRVRLTSYMNSLSNDLEEIFASQHAELQAPVELMSTLRHVFVSNRIAKPKTGEDETQYVARTEKLLNDLASRTDLEAQVLEIAQDPKSGDAKTWGDIKHVLGRLLHYRKAIDIVIEASKAWPELFTDFEVYPVPSPNPEENPLKRTPKAHAIIGRMTGKKEEMERYRSLSDKLRHVNGGLDKAIEDRCLKGGKNPKLPKLCLHCEVLLWDAFWRCQDPQYRRFFNGWKCMGVSKPPCLLCQYFFAGHESGISLRKSHGNFYLNWRFPYPHIRDQTPEAFSEASNKMVNGVLNRLRERVFRTLESGETTGREHDSNTSLTPWVYMSKAPSDTGTQSTSRSFSSSSSGGEDCDTDNVYGDEDLEAWVSGPSQGQEEDIDWHNVDGRDYTLHGDEVAHEDEVVHGDNITHENETVHADGAAGVVDSDDEDEDYDEGGVALAK